MKGSPAVRAPGDWAGSTAACSQTSPADHPQNPPSSTMRSSGLVPNHIKDGTKIVPAPYLQTAPKPPQAATTVLKTFLSLPSWLRNPSSALRRFTVHFAKPNSTAEHLTPTSITPPSHTTKDSSFRPLFLCLLLCAGANRVYPLHAGQIKHRQAGEGRTFPPSLSSAAFSAGPKLRW